MRMSSFIVKDAIVPRLKEANKEGVLREMVSSLVKAGQIREEEIPEIVSGVMRREALGSTGIGRHIAIPHSKHVGVTQLIGTLAISQIGIPFESIDGEPVYVLVLLISPPNKPGEHLRALECVVRPMKEDKFVDELRNAKSIEEIWAIIDRGN
ncbi:PTS sugar transporter subunit IIA [Telmatocola sphagniphila]|jgi:PTS system fructose-specific IIA component/PTS system nitrogen regulatory IIA component|uniref:PTS sugar transporter subunit IIA n=1 Tax=Telmatocola sphagniphila TaxID=1123043 RepID=A0A8E6B0Z7_9BACT|nr:PTS sugar transporter subunit IIA [Telmatocola sphagniphila]QVL29880.1 PTS sugar transporter subunit IIA [Telmatocola sphagniphila]